MSKDTQIQELIAALGQGEWRPSSAQVNKQSDAIDALVKIGAQSVMPLVAALADENALLRFGAVTALGWMRVLEPLFSMVLNDNDARIRTAAAFWLGHHPDVRSINPLIRSLKDDSLIVCDKAVSSLIALGQPVIKPILSALQALELPSHPVTPRSADETAFSYMVYTLGQLGNGEVADVLIPYLKHQNPRVRRSVVLPLAAIGDDDVISPLATMLQDEDEAIRSDAYKALSELGLDDAAIEKLR